MPKGHALLVGLTGCFPAYNWYWLVNGLQDIGQKRGQVDLTPIALHAKRSFRQPVGTTLSLFLP